VSYHLILPKNHYQLKLITKYNITILTTSFVFFTLFSIFFYQFTQSTLNENANDELTKQKTQVMNFVRNIDSLKPSYLNMDEKLTFELYPIVIRSVFVDTMLKMSRDSTLSPYRLLQFTYKKNDKRYKITIAKEMSYITELQKKIVRFEIIGLLALICIFSLLIIMLSRKLLKPLGLFCTELEHINMQTEYKFQGIQSTTKEFIILNDSFKTLIQRIQKDIENIRLFTENASHEMQTPLTVIQNSIELLIQKEGYDSAQVRLINNIANNANLLNKIHSELLLISKLEANHYAYDKEINYTDILRNVITHFSSLIEAKRINIQTDDIGPCIQQSNQLVANLLFDNLVMNAVKYAYAATDIRIVLNQEMFSIENTSDELPSDIAEKLFDRFFKGHRNSEGSGLGLSMVQQICLNLHYTIQYSQSNGIHKFHIIW
jgi:signal transduction histidine kinase